MIWSIWALIILLITAVAVFIQIIAGLVPAVLAAKPSRFGLDVGIIIGHFINAWQLHSSLVVTNILLVIGSASIIWVAEMIRRLVLNFTFIVRVFVVWSTYKPPRWRFSHIWSKLQAFLLSYINGLLQVINIVLLPPMRPFATSITITCIDFHRRPRWPVLPLATRPWTFVDSSFEVFALVLRVSAAV